MGRGVAVTVIIGGCVTVSLLSRFRWGLFLYQQGKRIQMSDLLRLSKPFPSQFIESKPGAYSADYVKHSTVNEFLLGIVGPFDWQLVQVLHEPDGMVSGAVFRMTLEIDGRSVRIEEVGSIQQAGNKNNGDRMKDAASDALKRCAMRAGLGLHLWSQKKYILHSTLESKIAQKEETDNVDSV